MQRRIVMTTAILLLLTSLTSGAAAQTPEATPAASPVASPVSEWQVADRREIDVNGQPVALSPDGRWIAGTGPDGMGVCVWEIESFEPTCVGDDVRPDRSSIAWSPDSSAVAFTDGSIREPEPNSLWLFSVANETVTARAGQDVTGSDAVDEPTIVAAPVWTPNSQQVLFHRVPASLVDDTWATEALGSTIASVDVDGGEVVPVSLPVANYSARIVPTADGRILFYVLGNQGSGVAGIWRAGLDGTELQQVLSSDDVPDVGLVQLGSLSPDQRTLLVWGIERPLGDRRALPAPFLLDLTTGDLEAVAPADGARLLWGSFPFATDASAAAVLAYHDDDETVYLQTLDVHTGETRRVVDGALEPWEEYWFVSWEAGNQVLIATDTSTVLLTLERTT